MLCDDKTDKCDGDGPVDLRVGRVSQALHKEVSIVSMGGNVMAKVDYDRLIVAFYLFISPNVVRSRYLVLCTMMRA